MLTQKTYALLLPKFRFQLHLLTAIEMGNIPTLLNLKFLLYHNNSDNFYLMSL